jgi:holo-[acyl-carrier protein] synthase
MIYGVGVDLVERARIERLHARHGAAFAKKILCARELKELAGRGKNPAHTLASAFAAKEAFVKALGTGFKDVGYRDAGVLRESSGKPVLIFSRGLAARLKKLGIAASHVSLSDDGGFVCAMVVLETR